jgi:hypothetical protein
VRAVIVVMFVALILVSLTLRDEKNVGGEIIRIGGK